MSKSGILVVFLKNIITANKSAKLTPGGGGS